ncbi:MAG: nucleotidyltransferase domain-containing protein [Treponema sp.]|nr:nucleotidyltransferase domain-containing protein [Treponema sp.]
MNYELPDRTLNTLESIFRKYPGILQVILYGSRAKGNNKKGSDIDLTLKTDSTFTRTSLLRIATDFDDSDIPYFVDISIYDKLTNPDLKAHIDRVGKVLYQRDPAEKQPIEKT